MSLALRIWYASGWLQAGRFFDEEVNVENVVTLLEAGRFAPANGFYPTLAYLPQTLVAAAIQAAQKLSGMQPTPFTAGRDLTPAGYLLCRLISIGWGMGALLTALWIGRRLFDRSVGLIACLVLAASPWQIHSSAYFKPDNLVTFALGLTFLWCLDALDTQRLPRFALAGAGMALSMSSKFTAASAPALLLVPALLEARRRPRLLLQVAFAGVVSLALFAMLNPQIDLFLRDFGITTRDYLRHAETEEMSRWTVLWGALRFPFDRYAHGYAVGALAVLGAVCVALQLRRGWRADRDRIGKLLLLVYPIIFLLVYSAGTPRLKENNFVPTLLFTSVLAAVAIRAAWDRLAARIPSMRSPRAGEAGLVLLFVVLTAPGFSYVYRSMVPSTTDLAWNFLIERLAAEPAGSVARLAIVQQVDQAEPIWEGERAPRDYLTAEAGVEDPDAVSIERRELSDVEVWRAKAAAPPRPQLDAVEGIPARYFRVRGPDLVVVFHPWTPAAPPRKLRLAGDPVGADGRLASLPPELVEGEIASLVVWFPFQLLERVGVARLDVGGRILDTHWASRAGRGHLLVTERFRVSEREASIRLHGSNSPDPAAQIDLYLWHQRSP